MDQPGLKRKRSRSLSMIVFNTTATSDPPSDEYKQWEAAAMHGVWQAMMLLAGVIHDTTKCQKLRNAAAGLFNQISRLPSCRSQHQIPWEIRDTLGKLAMDQGEAELPEVVTHASDVVLIGKRLVQTL